jgi:hypothetical protein
MRESGLADLLPSLPNMVWVGVSAGSMVMTPRIGADFVEWPSAPDDRTLGVVDFSIFPHLDAFPENTLADAWLGVACVCALVTLRRRRPSALFWLIASGSAGLYLFGMDFLYDVENGIFATGAGGVFEAVIVTLTLAFSLTALTWSWRERGELLGGA